MAPSSHSPEDRGTRDRIRVVVDLVGEAAHGLLAASEFVERPFLPGGEHNMYELAFAAAAGGFDVELRGWLDRAAFKRLENGAGVAPRVDLPARAPEPKDFIVMPEGWDDPLAYARLLLSPARLAIFLLAPPGLFGWPFSAPGWARPDPLTVSLDAVGRPEHFRAMHELGITLLSHSPGIVGAAEESGASCVFVGTGRPRAPKPTAEPRSVGVAALTANRWAPLVRKVARELDGLSVDLIDECSNEEVLARLGRARTLLWPSRIEGHATIPWEARSVGCVPVALSTNRFAVGLSEATGAVVVDHVDQLAPTIRTLLAHDSWLVELSKRAIVTAAEEVRWDAYADRVARFLQSVPPTGPERGALAGMGAALREWLEARAAQAQSSLEDISAEEQRLRADRDALAADRDAIAADRDAIAADRSAIVADRDAIARRLTELQDRKSVQLALRVADMRRRGAR